MSEILEIIPDNKGGQLKFRIDVIEGWGEFPESTFHSGDLVDIYEKDGKPYFFSLRDDSIMTLNNRVLTFNRPKGYGQVLWQVNTKHYTVLWTPHIGDEGYFDNDT